MTSKHLKSVDRLSGKGLLIPEGQEEQRVPVTYRLHIQRWMITPMPGDDEVEGTFKVSGSLQTDQLFPGIFGDNQYHLQLHDGTRVGVFIKSSSGTTHDLGISDANELAKKYERKDG